MKLNLVLFAMASVLVVSSCSGILPGVGILAPADLSAHRIDYSDLSATYEYVFSSDGSYLAKTRKSGDARQSLSRGTWKWERTNYDQATLVLDQSMTFKFMFTTDDHANGTINGKPRLYPFEFTKLKSSEDP